MRHASRDQSPSTATPSNGRRAPSTALARRAFPGQIKTSCTFNSRPQPVRARKLSIISRSLQINRSQFLATPSQHSPLKPTNSNQFLAADWHRLLAEQITRSCLASAFDFKGTRDQLSPAGGTLPDSSPITNSISKTYIFIHFYTFYYTLYIPSPSLFGHHLAPAFRRISPLFNAWRHRPFSLRFSIPSNGFGIRHSANAQFSIFINAPNSSSEHSRILNLYQCFARTLTFP